MEFEPMLTPRKKSPLPENVPRGGSNLRRCGQWAQTLPSYSSPHINVYYAVCIGKCVTKPDWLVDTGLASSQPVRELLSCMVWFAVAGVHLLSFQTFQALSFQNLKACDVLQLCMFGPYFQILTIRLLLPGGGDWALMAWNLTTLVMSSLAH